ncbi:MAG: calcineurin [Anaerofustis stercorihominis]|nr:calcineurin [Anaerofustis stercorihominis]
MIYVTSDLHGYDFGKFMNFLDGIGFTEEDFLFVLGDVIDRGEDGVKYLKWLTYKSNAQLILGNHESMLLACEFIFDTVTEDFLDSLDDEKMGLLTNWIFNGATPTMNALWELLRNDADTLYDILDYLKEAPLFEVVSAGEKDFLLTHSGLKHFYPDKKLSMYAAEELLWNRPRITDRYFDEIYTIFGHTPTEFLEEKYTGKITKTDTWACIDTGAATGHHPMVLRLDDMKEFYITN